MRAQGGVMNAEKRRGTFRPGQATARLFQNGVDIARAEFLQSGPALKQIWMTLLLLSDFRQIKVQITCGGAGTRID